MWVVVSVVQWIISQALLGGKKGTVLPLLKLTPPHGAVIPDLTEIRLLSDGEGGEAGFHFPSSPQAAWRISRQLFH